MSDARTPDGPDAPLVDLRERAIDRLTQERQKSPLPPKDVQFIATGKGIKCRITDYTSDDPEHDICSNVEYRVHHVATLDPTTTDGIKAGFVASVVKATVSATGGTVETIITDDDAQNGYFFCVGADVDKVVSEYTTPRLISGQKLLSEIPPPVARFAATESGRAADGTTFSVIDWECLAPQPKKSFAGIEFVAMDYPKIGEQTVIASRDYVGVGGGRIDGRIILPVGRRHAIGTVTVSNGDVSAVFGGSENCFANAKPGDFLEIAGVRQQIRSVDATWQVTFGEPGGAVATWPGPTVLAYTTYDFIVSVTMYARSYAQDHNAEIDLGDSPFVNIVLDGELSEPNPPFLVGACDPATKISTIGNVNRLFLTPVVGTDIKSYLVYKAKGAAVPWGDSTLVVIKTIEADHVNVSGAIQVDDTDFGVYERENNQIFSYYAVAVNLRDMVSGPSAIVQIACRLDAPNDNGPQNTAGSGSAKNILWNPMLSGAGTVALQPGQDANMGGPPPDGFYQWDHEETAAPTCGFSNTTEVLMPQAGVGFYAGFRQAIDAWAATSATARRIPIGAYLGFQMKARTTGGTPNGLLRVDISQRDHTLTHLAYARVLTRLATDVIDTSLTVFSTNPAELTADYRLYWAVFKLDPALAVAQILLRIYYMNGSSGANVVVTEPMLWLGTTLVKYNAEHVDPNITYPPPSGGAPTPPRNFPDGDATKRPALDIQI